MEEEKQPFVYIVGAGPGAFDLITVKGMQCIQQADILIYDYLVDQELLKLVKPSCELIYAGKTAGTHTLTQDEINNLLVQKAQEGNLVTRLKGGDPFVFGRGAEEAEFLAKHNIPFDIVPGITSAIAAPAYAGIPVTHRQETSMFTVVTGHEDPEKNQSSIHWEELAVLNTTLVFLMGVKNLPEITEKLIRHGKNPTTPVALIRWGTRPYQTVLTGTLQDIAEKVIESGMKPPCVIVVGDVVRLRNTINWYEEKPLFGKTIVVTRAREQASEFSRLLTSAAAHVVEFPTIKIIPPLDYSPIDCEIENLQNYDWVIFTSVNGVQLFMDRLFVLGKDARSFSASKICTIGSATAQKLFSYGLTADVVPQEFVAEAILAELQRLDGIAGCKFLLPRADLARKILPEKLVELGGFVTEIDIYFTAQDYCNIENLEKLLQEKKIDLVTFTSSSTVKNFVEAFKDKPLSLQDICQDLTIASIGPITSLSVQQLLGKKPEIEPTEHTIKGLYLKILEFYEQNKECEISC